MRWQKNDSEYIQSVDFVAFDTETTGIWAPTNRIVEVGAVKFRLGVSRAERFQSLVNPEREIPAEVVEIHGITNQAVQSSPTIKPVLESFFDFCGPDSILIAHNAMFDISFVGCEADRVGLGLPANPVLDTVEIFRQHRPGLDSYSLQALMRKFKLGAEQNHRATDDAALVWKLFSLVSQDFTPFQSSGEFKRDFQFYHFEQWQGEYRPLPDEFLLFQKAVDEELAIEIVYAANGQPSTTRIIRPRLIHNLRASFYVTGFCEKVQAERTFRLDRIKQFKLA